MKELKYAVFNGWRIRNGEYEYVTAEQVIGENKLNEAECIKLDYRNPPDEQLLSDLEIIRPKDIDSKIIDIAKADLYIYREAAGMTRAEIAERVGITTDQYRNIEIGRTKKKIEIKKAILRIFQFEIKKKLNRLRGDQ